MWSMDEKFQNINSQLVSIKYDLTKTMEDIVNDSLSKVKYAIIEGLSAEHLKLQQKVESLKSRISTLETDCNKQDQYNRRNNLEIHGIPSNISDDILEEKVIQIFEGIDVSLNANDIEDCHCLGKSGKNNIVRFVNRRICKKALENKKDLNNKLDNAKLGFQSAVKIFLSENLTPCNQHLAWMCKELKRARKIHSCWSSKGVVKIHRTMNERAITISHKSDIKVLYPDFVFKEKNRSK